MTDFDLRAHTHLLTVSGSRAYGLHRPESDVDLRGVGVPPVRYLFGFLRTFEQADAADEIEVFRQDLGPEADAARAHGLEGTVFGLAKFVRLAADCNPNILDVLFGREEEVRLCTPVGRRLREARDAFVSMRARYTYAGYAMSQLKRIEGHRAWLLSPPKAPPSRAAFGLPEHSVMPADQRAAANAAIDKQLARWQGALADVDGEVREGIEDMLTEVLEHDRWRVAGRSVGLDDNVLDLLDRERRYRAAATHWKQFQRWQKNRNPERAALEAAHGYDTKHAMHLVRLLRMGRELLETGSVHVWRGDRDGPELLAVRAGAWSYDQLMDEVHHQQQVIEALPSRGNASLPVKPDKEALDALCVSLVDEALRG